MNSSLNEYWQALERLKQGKSQRVPRGTRISNDSVSLEAGRGKGSIKKSREGFALLIAAVDEAAAAQALSVNPERVQLEKVKTTAANFRQELDAARGRDVALIVEVYALKKQLASLTGGNVLPIRPEVGKR